MDVFLSSLNQKGNVLSNQQEYKVIFFLFFEKSHFIQLLVIQLTSSVSTNIMLNEFIQQTKKSTNKRSDFYDIEKW